jgi:4-carboxymuconolactone decarboxylase
MTDSTEETHLHGLARGDAPVLEALLAINVDALERSGLDPDTYMLVRLAALVAIGAPPASWAVTLGISSASSMTADKAKAVLIAIAPIVGTPRVTEAAGNILRAVLGVEAVAEASQRAS